MIKKIIVLTIFLLLSVSIVCAVDINDFKLADGFNDESTNFATNGDFGLSVGDYDKDSDYDILFEDDDGYNVDVGEISKYTDKLAKQVGVLEIVEVDGEKVLIEIYSEDMGDLDECYDKLVEFNELNDLHPIEP